MFKVRHHTRSNLPTASRLSQILLTLIGVIFLSDDSLAQNLKRELAYAKNITADVTVIDIDTGTHIASVPILGQGGAALVLTPDQTRVYVADRSNNTVSVIETSTNTRTTDISVGPGPTGMTLAPDGRRLYVANHDTDTVSVVDTDPQSDTYHTEIDLIQVGQTPQTIAVTPCGSRAYVVNRDSNNITMVDLDPASPTYHTVTSTITILIFPGGSRISPDGNRLYVSRRGPGAVSVIDTDVMSPTFNTVVETIHVGTSPNTVAMTPDGSKLFVGDIFENEIIVIDTATMSVITTVSMDDGTGGNRNPLHIAFDSTAERAFVSKEVGLSAIIDTTTHSVLDFIAPGNGAAGAAIRQIYHVGGCFSGVTLRRVVCKNTTTGQKVVIRNIHESWDCEAAGLVVNTGDRIVQRMIGFAE